MPAEIMNIIWSAIGVVITGLVTWGVATFTTWINGKISDKKAANYLATIMNLVGMSVQEIYQTYVEALKKEGKFGPEQQKIAFETCLKKIKTKLAPDLIDYITKNFGDVDEYLKSLIESNIYSNKR